MDTADDPKARFAPKEGQVIPVINVDQDPRNADWPKRTWTLPPYKSAEFMAFLAFNGYSLAQFRQLPIYQFAVENGRIVNDEWQAEKEGQQ